MTQPSQDLQTFRRAFALTLATLTARLEEAQSYLQSGQDQSAIGTLVGIDDNVADLQAALRLFAASRRRHT